MATNPIKLKVPPQDFPEFTRFEANSQGAASWIAALSKNTPAEAAEQLTAVLDELTRHPLSPEARYAVAETLRPTVNELITSLSRQFYNLPPVIPKATLQSVERADQLCTLLGTLYTVVALETISNPESIKSTAPAKLACESLYRAITCIGQQVLQSLKLYRPLHMNGWLSLHQLYGLAESQQLANLPVPEPLDAGDTITSAYLQAVLIACCRPNQLRQNDIGALFSSLAKWSKLVNLSRETTEPACYLVDLQRDLPPLHREFYANKPGSSCRYIDTRRLQEKLRELQTAATQSGIERESRLPAGVIDHLINALANMSKRSFKRSRSDGQLSVTVGLKNSHFYIAHRKTFEQVLYGEIQQDSSEKPTTKFTETLPQVDVWHQANPSEDFMHSELSHPDQEIELDATSRARVFYEQAEENNGSNRARETTTDEYRSYDLQLTDISPGGYCLEWDEAGAEEIRNGDLVCIQEGHSEQWSVAAIRWLTRHDNTRMFLGLELLSPRGEAYGACIHQADGKKSAPAHALLLPEIKVVGRPSTLVTPRASFRVGQKVTLFKRMERHTVQLIRLVDTTGSYAQFEFKSIRELGDVLNEQDKDLARGDDSSLWKTV